MTVGTNRLQRFREKVFQAVLDGVRWITEPSADVDPKQHRRIRLLAAFILIMSVYTLIGLLSIKSIGGNAFKVMLATAIAFILGYFISRTRHYRIALGLAITLPAVPSLAIPILKLAILKPIEIDMTAELMWLALPMIFAALMLTVRQTIMIASYYIVLIIILKSDGLIEFNVLAPVMAYILIITFFTIVITYMRRRDQTELENQLSGRLRVEKTLLESEEKFRNLFEYTKDAIILADAQTGILVDINPAGCRLIGLPKEKIVGRHQSELHPPELAEKYKQTFRQHVEQGLVVSDDIIIRHADGSHIQCDLSASIIKMGDRELIQGVFRDISERKLMEKTLAEEATRRRILIEQSRDGIVILDQNGAVYETNRRFAEMIGYSQEEVMKLDVWDWEYQYPPEQVKEMIRTVTEEGDHFETRHRRKDGTIYDVEISTNGAKFGEQKLIFCVCRDITERKQAEGALMEREKRFSDIAENALEWIWEVDSKGKYTYSSPVVEKILGYKPGEVLKKHFYDFFLPEEKEELKKAAFEAFTQKQPFKEFINRNRCKTGKIVELMTSGVPVLDEKGNLLGYRGVDTDITERRKAEEALKTSEERFRLIADNSTDLISRIQLGPPIKTDYASPSCFRITGYKQEEFYTDPNLGLEMIHPDDREFFVKIVDPNKKGRQKPITVRLVRKDGGIVWIEQTHTVIRNERGEPVALHLIAHDITERRRSEQALKESEEKLSKAFHASPETIAITTLKDGVFLEVNDSFTRITGYTHEEVIGRSSTDINIWANAKDRARMLQILKKKGQVYAEEFEFRMKSGEIRTWLFSAEKINLGGEPCLISITIDITQRKQAEEELKQALAELERSSARLAATNKELEAFSYSVSHDLRSPLRSIDGFSQALLEDYQDKLDKTGQDYLKRLRGASQKMGELIDGLLKLSRLTRSEMRQEKVDLSALAEEIAGRLQETQPERRVKFVIDKGLTTDGDPELLRALLENLLGNAWKFTRNKPEAKIEFSLDHNGEGKSYFVRDNGAGFDMTYLDKLFGAFQRLHDTTEFPGTGIGLATVQRIINRHGGTIRAEGAVDKGATFYFTLN